MVHFPKSGFYGHRTLVFAKTLQCTYQNGSHQQHNGQFDV